MPYAAGASTSDKNERPINRRRVPWPRLPRGIKVSPQIQSHNRDDPAVNSAGGTGYSTLRKWQAAIAKQRDGKRRYTRPRAMPARLRSQGPIGLTQNLSQPIDTERLG